MTKKEMISELVKEFSFDESSLEDKLKPEVEKIYNDFFLDEEEENTSTGLEYGDDYVETNEDSELVDKSPSETEEKKEDEKIDESKLNKAQLRNLRRTGKI